MRIQWSVVWLLQKAAFAEPQNLPRLLCPCSRLGPSVPLNACVKGSSTRSESSHAEYGLVGAYC
jgi:hypothetical protein